MQKTAYKMRISYLSSDVCSFDLLRRFGEVDRVCVVCSTPHSRFIEKVGGLRRQPGHAAHEVTLQRGGFDAFDDRVLDLAAGGTRARKILGVEHFGRKVTNLSGRQRLEVIFLDPPAGHRSEIGRASCRERVCQYV